MYKVQLTTSSENDVTIYFNNNLTVSSYIDRDGTTKVFVLDGNHNNGGWSIKESYDEVIAKIDAAISSK